MPLLSWTTRWKIKKFFRQIYFHIKYRVLLINRYLQRISRPIRPYLQKLIELIKEKTGKQIKIIEVIRSTPGGKHFFVKASIPGKGVQVIKKQANQIPIKVLNKFNTNDKK